jgi:hypothetical protein
VAGGVPKVGQLLNAAWNITDTCRSAQLLLFPAVLRIRDVYPESRLLIFTHPRSRIPDLGSRIQKQQQKRGVKKKFSCYTFLCSHKFHKIENYFSFEVMKKKIWANSQRIIELFFYPKNCH